MGCSVWFAVGLVITVAISWGLAAWMPMRGWDQTIVQVGPAALKSDPGAVAIQRLDMLGCSRQAWVLFEGHGATVGHQTADVGLWDKGAVTKQYEDTTVPFGWPRWGRIPDAIEEWALNPDKSSKVSVDAWRSKYERTAGLRGEVATGLPVRALWCPTWKGLGSVLTRWKERFSPAPKSNKSGRRVFVTTNFTEKRDIPYLPIWSGLVIDSVIWGSVAYGGWRLVLSAFAARRRRRGLCPACSYPIGVSPVCTECGCAVKPNTTAA